MSLAIVDQLSRVDPPADFGLTMIRGSISGAIMREAGANYQVCSMLSKCHRLIFLFFLFFCGRKDLSTEKEEGEEEE